MKRFFIFVWVLGTLALAGGKLLAQKSTLREAEACAKTLKTDKDPDKRLQAARALANIVKIKVSYVRPHTGVLIQALKTDSDPLVRAAAGSVLLAFDADPNEVVPAILELVKNDKEPGVVLALAARLAAAYQARDAIPALEALKKREEAKDDPKLRDQRLLQALNQALQALAK